MEQQTGMADLAFPASNAPEPLKEKPDLLSRLPAEMLDFIFREAWTDGRPSGPINRALLPWTDRSHWHTIILKSVDSCERYRETCERRPHLPYACDTLCVELDVHKEELGREWLEQLLPGMINLHHLSLSDLSGPALEHLLGALHGEEDEQPTALLPPQLCTLSLTCTTGKRQDPYHPSWWQEPLSRLPKLEEIRLNLRSSNAPAAKLEASEEYSFSQVRRLAVTLPRKGRSSVHLLIASCLNFHGLGLSSAGPAPGFAGALASLTNPSMYEFRPDPFLAHLQGGGLPHLKTLRFDNVTATRGWVVGDNLHPEAFLWRDRIEQIRCAMKSWKPARWTPVFVRSNAYALREVCRARKIRLEGSIIEALQVADALAGMKDEIKQLRRLISRSGDGPSAASP